MIYIYNFFLFFLSKKMFFNVFRPYSLDSLDDYEKHFTVMNYEDDFPLRQVNILFLFKTFSYEFPHSLLKLPSPPFMRNITEKFSAQPRRDAKMIMMFGYLVRHGEVVQAEYFSLPFHILYFLFPHFFFLPLPSLSFSSLSCHSLCLLPFS